jgi:hypothetical protein
LVPEGSQRSGFGQLRVVEIWGGTHDKLGELGRKLVIAFGMRLLGIGEDGVGATHQRHEADRTIADFGDALGERLAGVVGPALVGAYLHGSAALGGFQPGASDLDIVVVVNDRWQPEMRDGVVRVLQESHGSSPGRGIEASVIWGEVAQAGGRRIDFEVHVSTDPTDRKVVIGGRDSGDPDLILHMAVCRQSAIAVLGPDPMVIFAEVDPTVVISQMIGELAWALTQVRRHMRCSNGDRRGKGVHLAAQI